MIRIAVFLGQDGDSPLARKGYSRGLPGYPPCAATVVVNGEGGLSRARVA